MLRQLQQAEISEKFSFDINWQTLGQLNMERQKKHNNNNVHISTQEKSERENYTKVVMQKQMLLPATSYNKRDQKSEKKIEIKDPTAATESTTQQSSSRYVVYCSKELIHILRITICAQ